MRPVDRSIRARSALADVAYTGFSTRFAGPASAHVTAVDLMINVLQAYSDAVGAETAGFYEHVRDGWSKANFILPAEAWLRLPFTRLRTKDAASLHPGVRHALAAAPTEPFSITDLVSQRTWLESDLGEAMKPQWGRNLQLMTPVTDAPGGAVCRVWVLGRPSSDFSTGDREVASALQPLLGAITRHYVTAIGHELPADSVALVTEREGVVLALVLAGDRPSAIAVQLGISVRTVHKHLERIYRKFDVHDRQALAHVVDREMRP
jgi:DNA-binding CsgD family transcriptional regulator